MIPGAVHRPPHRRRPRGRDVPGAGQGVHRGPAAARAGYVGPPPTRGVGRYTHAIATALMQPRDRAPARSGAWRRDSAAARPARRQRDAVMAGRARRPRSRDRALASTTSVRLGVSTALSAATCAGSTAPWPCSRGAARRPHRRRHHLVRKGVGAVDRDRARGDAPDAGAHGAKPTLACALGARSAAMSSAATRAAVTRGCRDDHGGAHQRRRSMFGTSAVEPTTRRAAVCAPRRPHRARGPDRDARPSFIITIRPPGHHSREVVAPACLERIDAHGRGVPDAAPASRPWAPPRGVCRRTHRALAAEAGDAEQLGLATGAAVVARAVAAVAGLGLGLLLIRLRRLLLAPGIRLRASRDCARARPIARQPRSPPG
jgi:hypothetical protein